MLYGWRITTNDIHVIFRKWLENCLKNLWKEDVIILCHRPEIRTKKEETKWCLKPTIVINNDKSSSLSLGEISLLQLLVRWCLCTRYSDSNDYLRFSCDQTLSSSDYFEETYVHTFHRNWFELCLYKMRHFAIFQQREVKMIEIRNCKKAVISLSLKVINPTPFGKEKLHNIFEDF